MWLNNKYCSGNELDFTVTMNLPSFVACLKSQFPCTWHSCQCPWYWDVLCRYVKTCKQGQKHILITNIAIQWNEKSWVWKKWQKCEGDCVFLTLFLSFLEYNETHILCLYILGLLVTDGGTFLNGLKCHNCWHFHVEGFWMDTYHYFDDHIFNLDSLSTNSFSN